MSRSSAIILAASVLATLGVIIRVSKLQQAVPAPDMGASMDKPYHMGNSVYRRVHDYLAVMAEAGHYTSWDYSDDATIGGEKSAYFFLFTADQDTAKKIHDTLEREKLLCHTQLNRWPTERTDTTEDP